MCHDCMVRWWLFFCFLFYHSTNTAHRESKGSFFLGKVVLVLCLCIEGDEFRCMCSEGDEIRCISVYLYHCVLLCVFVNGYKFCVCE